MNPRLTYDIVHVPAHGTPKTIHSGLSFAEARRLHEMLITERGRERYRLAARDDDPGSRASRAGRG